MKKLIVANWKMNIPALAGWKRSWKFKRAEIAVAPPFPFISSLGKIISGAGLAAQNSFWEAGGAYTGEVSPPMLKRLGVKYVILGHSERRRIFGETDKMINKKVLAAFKEGLKVILCVGEPVEIRRKGVKAVGEYLRKQIRADLTGVGKLRFPGLVIAYEPIWAIGTGRYDSPSDAKAAAVFIKNAAAKAGVKNISVLYGGSVDSQNAGSFLKLKEIDGALVGRASLKASEFLKIIKSIL